MGLNFILNLGQALPQKLDDPGSLPYRDTFYLVGGSDWLDGHNKMKKHNVIYMYDPKSGRWIKPNFSLSQKEAGVQVVNVKESAFYKN